MLHVAHSSQLQLHAVQSPSSAAWGLCNAWDARDGTATRRATVLLLLLWFCLYYLQCICSISTAAVDDDDKVASVLTADAVQCARSQPVSTPLQQILCLYTSCVQQCVVLLLTSVLSDRWCTALCTFTRPISAPHQFCPPCCSSTRSSTCRAASKAPATIAPHEHKVRSQGFVMQMFLREEFCIKPHMVSTCDLA